MGLHLTDPIAVMLACSDRVVSFSALQVASPSVAYAINEIDCRLLGFSAKFAFGKAQSGQVPNGVLPHTPGPLSLLI